MSDYKEVHGTAVLSYAGDVPNVLEGQVWYNSTAGDFRVLLVNLGSWASGNNMNTGRSQLGGAGTQTAALAFGGGPGSKNETETYNGTAWTEVNNLNTARASLGGSGANKL